MKENIVVSICCQTYNHKDFISQAIESFLMQKTNFKFEILLRDDASTDGTAEIAMEYSDKYPDIIVPLFYTENQFQKGVKPFADNVKRARGKYIAICEGDDYWTDPYKLQKQVDLMENDSSTSICHHSFDLITLRELSTIQREKILKKNNYENLYQTTFLTYAKERNIKTLTILFRVYPNFINNLNEVFYSDNSLISGDYSVILLLLTKGNAIFLKEKMGVYRVHEGGITNNIRGVNSFSKYILAVYKFIEKKEHKTYAKKYLWRVAKSNLIKGEIKLFFRIINEIRQK